MGILSFAVIAACSSSAQDDASLVAMGRDRWMAQVRQSPNVTNDDLAAAERKFSMALVAENERLILAQANQTPFREVQTLIANVCKGSCRLGDFATEPAPLGYVLNRKAESLVVISFNRFITNAKPAKTTTQADFWRTYRELKTVHQNSREKIEAYANRSSGYKFEQHMIEYESIGYLSELLFKKSSSFPTQNRAEMFSMCEKLIRLTTGEDPLPYTN